MPYLLLPRLTENTPIAAATAGQWEDNTGLNRSNFLRGLSDSLVVAATTGAIDSIDSIPDVWARPILFRMALFASQGFDMGLHRKVLGEWRALLAMLALQDMRHLNLTVDAVHLKNLAESGQLGQTFSTLAPQDSIRHNGDAAKADWNDIYVISYNGVPLAITSPATLIMPAADYSNTLKGTLTLPWSDDGRHLIDPIPYLMSEELGGLHLWLTTLKTNLTATVGMIGNDTFTKLSSTLQQYIDDVSNQAHGNFPAVGGLVPAGLNMFIGTSALLDKKVQPPTPNPNASAVLLKTSTERANSNKRLLISRNMLDDLAVSRGLSPAQIVIWPGITAANFKESHLTHDKTIINNITLTGAEWRRPEDFFTDNLVTLSRGNTEEGCFNSNGVRQVPGGELLVKQDKSIILPLRAEILDYFTPEEIARNFRIESTGTAYKVQFTFPISGINNTGAEYKAEKLYPMQGVISLSNKMPVVEIWPNFKRTGWKKYYLYYENNAAQNNAHASENGYLYVYPWAYENNIAGDTPKAGLANRYTARLGGFPEALICTTKLTDKGEVYAGIILLNEPAAVPASTGRSWQIAMDFGTSSTMLYYRDGSAMRPLVLQPNLFQVTNSGDLRQQTYRNFIPSQTTDQQDGSFQSIFQLLNGSHMNATPPAIYPLQDGNVYWVLDPKDKHFRNSQIDSNLKWGVDTVSQLKVEAYIKQICLQSLAEAAKEGIDNITWNFSYPTAFSPTKTTTFRNTCQAAVNEATQDCGFNNNAQVVPKPEYWPETKATAYYFSNLGGNNFAGGAVCMDIGAGTTDISVISGNSAKIIYHTSLQFAGRYLFQSIYQNYNLFAKNLNLNAPTPEKRDTIIDADMRRNSQNYLTGLNHQIVDLEVQNVLRLAQFAVAGIFYYIGGLVKQLKDMGIYEGDSVPEIYIGGNGSRIFPWICGGTFSSDNPYIEVFKDMLVDTSGLSETGYRIILSGTPKIEVASGMIEDDPNPAHKDTFFNQRQIAINLFGAEKGVDPLIASSVFAGDNFTIKDQPFKKTDFISAYNIANGIRVNKVDELRTFITKFNKNPNIWARININDNQFARVTRTVQGAYNLQVDVDPQEIFVEPVFILEMKGAMSLFKSEKFYGDGRP